MRRLKVYRVLHWLNDTGREVDSDGKPVRQEVNLRRLILLIKPVSRCHGYHKPFLKTIQLIHARLAFLKWWVRILQRN